MITRFRISGFKNLTDVDVSFGPFTCIAGPNGVGKSNLIDAIEFLGATARMPLMEAARLIRPAGSHHQPIRELFSWSENGVSPEMAFTVDVLIPPQAVDDRGETVTADLKTWQYSLKVGLLPDTTDGTIRVLSEDLKGISPLESGVRNWPSLTSSYWTTGHYYGDSQHLIQPLSTEQIHLKCARGAPMSAYFMKKGASRTMLSHQEILTALQPAALSVQRELSSWRVLHLDPTSIRVPDNYGTQPGLLRDGSHLPATLAHFERIELRSFPDPVAHVSGRLHELLGQQCRLSVERDDARELVSLRVDDSFGKSRDVRNLSDGTLRMIAFATLEVDPASALWCIEEPENGFQPSQLPGLVSLFRSVAFDPEFDEGLDNPLRQVIITTQSPGIVGEVRDDEILIAEPGSRKRVSFGHLSGTWREKAEGNKLAASRIHLLNYLRAPVGNGDLADGPKLRLREREDIRQLLGGSP